MAKKRQVPECSIVPGMLSGVNYAELIKRDSSTVIGTVEPKKSEKAKTKVYKARRK